MDARDLALQASCPVLAVPRFGPLPPMANGQRLLVAANGVFVQVRLDWLDCIQRLSPAFGGFPLPYGDVQEQIAFAFPRLPIRLIEQFLVEARMRLPDEAAGALVYSRGTGQLRLVVHSPLSASSAHIDYGVLPLDPDETLAVDLHTHGRLPAFWSPTDNRDDNGIKIAAVFGDLHRPQPTAKFRLVLNRVYRALPHPWEQPDDAAHLGFAAESAHDVEVGTRRRILSAVWNMHQPLRPSGPSRQQESSMMYEWDVYIAGKYVGTVHESSEALARCAALSRFDPSEDVDISVSKR